jgi:hypothetical protein
VHTHLLTRTARRRLAVLVGASLAATVVGTPAEARPPERSTLEVVTASCVVEADSGTFVLNVIHETPATIGFGADVQVYEPGADPTSATPVAGGFSPDVARDGDSLRGEVPIRAWGDDGPGQGVGDHGGGPELGEPLGSLVYDLSFEVGAVEDEWEHAGPISEHRERTNARFRTAGVRSSLTASGTVTLPDGATMAVSCAGDEVRERVFVTSPATTVGSARYPVEFRCEPAGPGDRVAVTVYGDQAEIQVYGTGADEPRAFGGWFVEEGRDRVVGSIPMVDRDLEELGDAVLDARLTVLDRRTVHHRDGGTFRTDHVETLAVEGAVTFDGVRYDLEGCEGTRLRTHRITRGDDHAPAPAATTPPRG